MKRTTAIFLIASIVIMLSPVPVKGQAILGKRYIGISGGIAKVSDDVLEEIDDTITTLGVLARFPVTPKLDVVFSAARSKLEGDVDYYYTESFYYYSYYGAFYYEYPYYGYVDIEITATQLNGGLQYHFAPGNTIDPVIGASLVYVSVDAEANGFSEDDSDTGFSIGAGLELAISEKASILPSIGYSNVGDEDDFGIGLDAAVWLNETFAITGGIGYAFDSELLSFAAGLLIGF